MTESIVKTINEIVEKLIGDIKKKPFQYLQEIDVQIELAHRLKNKIEEMKDTVSIWHGKYNKEIEVSRLLSETYIQGNYHPDLIILSENQEESDLNTGKFRADWVCEIKVKDGVVGMKDDFERLVKYLSSEESILAENGTQNYICHGVIDYNFESLKKELENRVNDENLKIKPYYQFIKT